MSCTLEIIGATPNRVSFKCKFDGCIAKSDITYNSPTITLTGMDKRTVSFVVSAVNWNSKLKICVKQDTGRAARGIVTLAVQEENNEATNAITTTFVEEWIETCEFYPMGSLCSQFIITGQITWLGFTDEDQTPTLIFDLPLPAESASFGDKSVPDIKIFVGEKEIKAHKVVLARHSPMLLAMFETPKEPKNQVIIKDVTSTLMQLTMDMIYSGDIKDLQNVNTALEILDAAEKYQMLIVKSICEWKLQLSLTDDNVLTVLEMADMCNAKELCQTCVDYIIARKKKIVSVEDFRNMCDGRPNLLFAIFDSQIDKLHMIPSLKSK